MSAELLTCQGKLIHRLHREGLDPLLVVFVGSGLWPEGAPEPEFGVLFAQTADGERYTVSGDPKTVSDLGGLIDLAERNDAPRKIRRLIQRRFATAELRTTPGWPDDIVEGGRHD